LDFRVIRGNGVNQMRKFLKKRSKKLWKRSKTFEN